jgi:hypothetical protein
MKKLLFLLACALLLLAATAVPASAAVTYYWVDLNDYSVSAVDEVNKTFIPVRCVPRYSDARLGYTTTFLNRGLTTSFQNALLFDVTVTDRYGNEVARCKAEASADHWGAPYHLNDWLDPADWFYPPNPAAIAAGIWEVDWTLQLPPLPPGVYTVEEWDTLTRTIADPMWEVTPGTGTPIHTGWPWTRWEGTFRVR